MHDFHWIPKGKCHFNKMSYVICKKSLNACNKFHHCLTLFCAIQTVSKLITLLIIVCFQGFHVKIVMYASKQLVQL